MPPKKQKIIYVVTKGYLGGAQRYILDLTTGIKETHDITVAHGEGDALAQELGKEKIKTVKIQGLGRDMKIFSDARALVGLYKLIKAEKPDILHLNSSKAGGLGSLAGRFAGVKKIIVTIHGFPFREDRHPLWTAIIKTLSWVTVCLATDVIFVCKLDKVIAEKWAFKPRLHLIHNGIGNNFYQPTGAARKILENYGVESDFWIRHKHIVGTVAELHKNKGLTFAIDAISAIPETGYVIIGDGENKEDLERKIRTLGLSTRVRLTGFVANAQILLKAFDIFLLPSVKEGLPYVLLEAASAGVPIIATDTGGVSEIINKKSLVRTKESRELAAKLAEIVSDNNLAKEVAESASANVKQNFSLISMINLTMEVYHN